jgi:hypothetical protein
MKKLALLILLVVVAVPMFADTTVWYNGDFNGVNGLTNEVNTTIPQSYIYDDFIVPTGGWTLTDAFSNNLMSFSTSNADVEIRSGVSAGNPGTLVYGAYGVAATQTATGRSGFGYNEYTIEVALPSVYLPAGTYWLAVAPDGSGSGRSFISTTSGANCIGLPCGNDDNSFWTSAYYGTYFTPASSGVGFPADFSMGVSTTGTSTPEPSTLLLMGTGLLGAVGAFRRKINL